MKLSSFIYKCKLYIFISFYKRKSVLTNIVSNMQLYVIYKITNSLLVMVQYVITLSPTAGLNQLLKVCVRALPALKTTHSKDYPQ